MTSPNNALISAIISGDVASVKKLIDEKPERVEMRDEHKWTPLMWAAATRHDVIAIMLLNAGADVLAQDEQGQTARVIAIEAEAFDTADLLAHKESERFERDARKFSIAQGKITLQKPIRVIKQHKM